MKINAKKRFILMNAILLTALMLGMKAYAAPNGLSFQGRLVNDGVAVEGNPITLILKITSPDANECVLFEESHTLNMIGSDGIFNIKIGGGIRTGYDEGLNLIQVFSNTGTEINNLTCAGGVGSYTPGASDSRNVYVTFVDNGTTVSFSSPYIIQSVPYALEAERLAGKTANDFLQVTGDATQTKLNDLMVPATYAEILALLNGASTKYLTSSTTDGTSIPVLSSQPASLSAGEMWYEGGALKYYDDSSSTVKTLGTSSNSLADGNIWIGNASNQAAAVTPSSDVSMTNTGAFTVIRLQNQSVASTAPNAGQVLKHNGAQWAPAYFNVGDLKTSLGGSQFASASCNANQTLNWTAVTDTFTCQNITSLDAGAITSGTIATARLPASATFWQDGGSGKVYYNGGNVGIGTATPTSKLHVYGGDALVNGVTVGLGPGLISSNLAIGEQALNANAGTTTSNSTAIGYRALYNFTTTAPTYAGSTAIGSTALGALTTGAKNTAVGRAALANISTGSNNTAIGDAAGQFMGGGASYNTALGALALYSPGNFGSYNTAVGYNALFSITTGSKNMGLGYNAGSAITTGSNNVIIGSNDGSTIATSSNTILVADGAGNERMRIDATGNVGIGTTVPNDTLEVAGNVRIGSGTGNHTTLSSNATSTDTTLTVASTTEFPSKGTLQIESELIAYSGITATSFTGLTRGLYGTTAAAHTAGAAMYIKTLSLIIQNDAVTTPPLRLYSDGGLAIGTNATKSTGRWSVAIGPQSIASGDRAVALGYNNTATSWHALALGNASTANGWGAVTLGVYTTSSGYVSLAQGHSTIAKAYAETVLGAFNKSTGTEHPSASTAVNPTDPLFVVGNGTSTTRSNALMLFQNGQLLVNGGTTVVIPTGSAALTSMGSTTDSTAASINATDSAGSSKLYVRNDGNVGIGTTSPSYRLDVDGDINTTTCFRIGATTVSGTCTSDARLKENIQNYGAGLKELLGIRLRTYQFNGLGEMPKTGETAVGVIAQEVESTNPELVKTRMVQLRPDDKEKTEIKVVDYSKFTYMLINAVKELYAKFEGVERGLASVIDNKADKADLESKIQRLEIENAAKVEEIEDLKVKSEKAEKENAAIKAYLCGKDESASFCVKQAL